MSKLIAAGFAGSGVVAVSVGGTYLMKNESGAEDAANDAPTSKDKEDARTLSPKSLDEFKSSQGDICSKSLFESLDFSTGLPDTQFTQGNPQSQDFFGTPSSVENKNKSCLTIAWKKQTKKEGETNKGSGIFTGSWFFINDKKGFVIFNVAKTTTDKKLKLTGGAYLLEKEGNPETGKIKHYRVVQDSDNKEIPNVSSDFDQNFPKAKNDDSSIFKVDSKVYGGFVDDGTKLNDICSDENCGISDQGDASKPTIKSGNGSKGEGGKLTDWNNDLKGWEFMYGKDKFDLEQSLTSFNGSWTKQ